ncbi:hypothetical protein BVC93_28615 [Mycobacterium sp. MS1601]|nr:hypothetical protein BVC93_28615 [Mycobacterium sp. MS1601]
MPSAAAMLGIVSALPSQHARRIPDMPAARPPTTRTVVASSRHGVMIDFKQGIHTLLIYGFVRVDGRS